MDPSKTLGVTPVDVVIEREPCYLLEAAELAYSLVNDIPAEKLSGTGLYCIPAEAIQRHSPGGLCRDREPPNSAGLLFSTGYSRS